MEGKVQMDNIDSYRPKNCLFLVERDIDDHLVLYTAITSSDGKRIKKVDVSWSSLSNIGQMDEMSDKVKDNIFGVTPVAMKPYSFKVKVFQEKNIECHVRQSLHITTKCIINNKECKLLKIYVKLSKFPFPKINEIIVYGLFKDQIESESLEIPDYSSLMSLIFG